MTHLKSANSARGETSISIGEQIYILRPSFGALAAAEAEIGSLFDFVERAASGKALLTEVIALFWHCLCDARALEPPIERGSFSQNMASAGMVGLTPALKVILRQILQGQ